MADCDYDPRREIEADRQLELPCESLDELSAALAEAGIDEVRRMFGRSYLMPLYHIVGDEPVVHVRNLFEYCSTALFEQDLDWCLERFTPVGLDDILAYVNGRGSLPDNFMHLTIDDGMRQAGEVIAPLLEQKGIPATLFVCPEFVDNKRLFYRHRASCLVDAAEALTGAAASELADWAGEAGPRKAILSISWSERHRLDVPVAICGFDDTAYLREVRPYLETAELLALRDRGFSLGAHSLSHPLYKTVDPATRRAQTLDSLNWVREHLDPECRAFSFPFNETGLGQDFYEAVTPELDVLFGLSFFSPEGVAGPLLQRCPMDRADRFEREAFLAKWFAHYHWSSRC